MNIFQLKKISKEKIKEIKSSQTFQKKVNLQKAFDIFLKHTGCKCKLNQKVAEYNQEFSQVTNHLTLEQKNELKRISNIFNKL